MNQPVASITPIPAPPYQTLVSFENAIRSIVPSHPVTRVLFPDRPDQPLRFVVYEGSRRKFYKASNLFFHPSTGALLRADLLRDRLAGDSLVHWIGAVHFGAFGGWAVKVVWTLSALALSIVAISGLVLFVQRR